jgi:hypothetical protein
MKIKIKRSETECSVPSASDLDVGELAMNSTDKKIFTKDSSGLIVELGGTGKTTNALSQHSYTISENYSIDTGNNAISVGGITINSGKYVEISSASIWAII